MAGDNRVSAAKSVRPLQVGGRSESAGESATVRDPTGPWTGIGIYAAHDPHGGHVTVQVGMSDDALPYYRCRGCGWGRVGGRPDHTDAPCDPLGIVVAALQEASASSDHGLRVLAEAALATGWPGWIPPKQEGSTVV